LRGRGTTHRIRGSARAMMITQVALSMVLIVGAGLFVTTLSNLYANDLQQRQKPILFTRLARVPLKRTTVLSQPYFQSLQEQLATMPGADLAAFSVFYPAYLGFFDTMPTDTVSAGNGVPASAVGDHVTPGFFELYAIARLRGRDFTWSDHETAPKVAIVNDTLARKLSASGEVVGQRVKITSGPVTDDVEIVGVVADASVSSIRERHVAGIYRPMMQDVRRGQNPMTHVRVAGDVAAAQRHYVDVVDARGEHLVRAIFTMDGWVDNAVVEQQLIAGMAGVAGTFALVLACVGLFGLLAYSVSSRVREIGVRVSIGATAGQVVRMIVREGLVVVIPGLAVGIPIALAAAWVVRSQLYGVSATDPWTVAGASLVFIVTAVIASWFPARRAARIQPIDALRQD
jgi:predicted permease